MLKYLEAAKSKRSTALAENTGTGAKTAGPGRFEVKMISAEIAENRAKTAKQAKIVYEVTRVIKGDEDSDLGATITEYISQNHSAESMSRRYTVLANQLLDAGLREDKIADEDDATLWDAVVTATQAAAKALTKEVEIRAALDRVQTQKMAENGKPYYNNYFIELESADKASTEEAETQATEQKPAASAKPPVTESAAKKKTVKDEVPESDDTTPLPF